MFAPCARRFSSLARSSQIRRKALTAVRSRVAGQRGPEYGRVHAPSFVVKSRFFSTDVEKTPAAFKQGDKLVDLSGHTWVYKKGKEEGDWFWYNESTWETRNSKPLTEEDDIKEGELKVDKPEYATDWEDPRFPEWVQYVEFNSKRKYYHNRATNEVTWAPPDDPTLDIFRQEIEEMTKNLTAVPSGALPAPTGKRLAAGLIDMGLSLAGGIVFGGLVYIDIENVVGSSAAVGFMAWGLFLGRDMIIERGTRSPGKKLMKLEIVREDGQLPSRWNTFFRQSYLPVYAASSMLMPYIFAFAASDLGLMLFTPKHQRIGDFIGRTRVIAELPDREERLAEKIKRDDEDDAKE